MIWLFKVKEGFWGDKPKVNEHYLFDTDDVEFDITQYDISLYFALADYYLLNDSNEGEVYQLRFESVYGNPLRTPVPEDYEIYGIVKNYYIDNNGR